MYIGSEEFCFGTKTYVMGILNVTPDSFSDGGSYCHMEEAIAQALKMEKDGADLIDLGGESTRPGYQTISDEEEIKRVVPAIRELKKKLKIPVSIDTYKSNVARAAVMAGADLINDIWGFRHDKELAKVAKEFNVPVCLMHNREKAEYTNLISEIREDLLISIKMAKEAGIADEKIILDPGIGFGKTYEQNVEVMRHLEEIVAIGYPVLLGTSRKNMIGITLDLPTSEREEGTIATSVIGAMAGCDFIRVHDVKKNVRALKMTDAIMRKSMCKNGV